MTSLGAAQAPQSPPGIAGALACNALKVMMLPLVGAGDEVTPDVTFGGGNLDGGYTIDRQNGVELGLRGKLRYPAMNVWNENGDGTYTFNIGTGGGPAGNSEWSYEFAANTDYDNTTGWTVGDLTYELGLDNDPGTGPTTWCSTCSPPARSSPTSRRLRRSRSGITRWGTTRRPTAAASRPGTSPRT